MSNYKIQFKDGTALPCLSVTGGSKSIKGAERDSLTFNFNLKEVSADRLYALFAENEENLGSICISESESSGGYIHSDYCIFDGISISRQTIVPETNSKEEETVTIAAVTMGQLTYSEKAERERKRQLENMSVVLADILGGAL